MQPAKVFSMLSQLGLTLRPLPGGRLYVEPQDRITPEARAIIVAERDMLVELLHAGVKPNPAAGPSFQGNNPADGIDVHRERPAICSEAGDIASVQAQTIACAEVGCDLDALACRQIVIWRGKFEMLPTPTDHRLVMLVPTCLSILDELWLMDAIRWGWTDADLFGLDVAAPNAYYGNGIVTGIALTALRRPVRVVAVDGDFATVETGTGSRLRHSRRAHPGRPIWQHPAFARLWH